MQTLTDGPMTVEVYDRDVRQDEMESLELASVMDEYAKRMELAKGLGLESQVSRLKEARLTTQLKSSIPFEYLEGETLKVWQRYLPMKYGTNEGSGWRLLKYYAFDLIPFSVLELWRSCEDKQVFDAYQVWTTEKDDPILVGYKTIEKTTIGPWLIARWGESLKAFSEIQEEVKQMGTLAASSLGDALRGQKEVSLRFWNGGAPRSSDIFFNNTLGSLQSGGFIR